MRIDEVLEKIFNMRTINKRITNESLKQNNEKLRKIYELLGEPCKNKKIIHIAGTNGKGSTATFLEGIFFAAGYSIAKFTSPHILRFNERILVDKEMISDEEIVKYYEAVMDILEKNSLQINFFEITTFMALLYFETKNPDFIFLETGLGGRYDATNVVNSTIAAITNVSFDHVSLLGNSLEKIADRKAGIIKDGQLCIYAQNLAELENAVKKETDNSVNVLKKYENLQVELDTQNYTILDVAHNDDSVRVLVENLNELFKNDEVIFILSILGTKDIANIFKKILEKNYKIFITSLKDVTYGLSANEIKKNLENANILTNNIIFEDNILVAYNQVKQMVLEKNSRYRAIVVCGSFYEIAKFKKLCGKRNEHF